LLFAIAAMGLALSAAGQVWHTTARREREAELLAIGNQYREALKSYYDASAVGTPRSPLTLEELVLDRRFPEPLRHLRRLYPDPITNRNEWALMLQQGRITGVHSQSTDAPMKSGGFLPRDEQCASAKSYADWVFSFTAKSAP